MTWTCRICVCVHFHVCEMSGQQQHTRIHEFDNELSSLLSSLRNARREGESEEELGGDGNECPECEGEDRKELENRQER